MTKIDVRECEHYWNTHNLELCKINFDNNYYSNGLPLAEKCNDHTDCYYKQLKRLELENKKLKELLETRCYNEVEFENKKLKEALVKIKSFFNPEYNDYQTNTIKKMMKDIIEEAQKDE